MPLKLYVWEDVLQDYTSGMAVALAESKEAALAQLEASGLYRWSMDELRATEPVVCETPCAFWVHGGG